MPTIEKTETNKSLAVRILISCVDPKANAEALPSILKNIHDVICELDVIDNAKSKGNVLNISSAISANLPDPDIIKKTVFDDYIVCLEDGLKFRSLKRHLKYVNHLTFEEYKEKWNLPNDYPSVCGAYSKTRSEIAFKFKLGKNKGTSPVCLETSDMFKELPAIHLVKKSTTPVKLTIDPLDL